MMFCSLPVEPQPYNRPLILNDSLESLVCSLNIPAAITEVQSNQYIIASAAECERRKLDIQAYTKLTVRDLAVLSKLPEAIISKILKENQEISAGTRPNSLRKLHFLSPQEFVIVEQNFKKPILNANGKIAAILGTARDITPYCNLCLLFSFYEHYFEIKKAIQQFLCYLQIDQFFYKSPTRRELMTLLAMRENFTSKQAGNALNITARTIEEYKNRLRVKLHSTTLDELLLLLVKRNEYDTLSNNLNDQMTIF